MSTPKSRKAKNSPTRTSPTTENTFRRANIQQPAVSPAQEETVPSPKQHHTQDRLAADQPVQPSSAVSTEKKQLETHPTTLEDRTRAANGKERGQWFKNLIHLSNHQVIGGLIVIIILAAWHPVSTSIRGILYPSIEKKAISFVETREALRSHHGLLTEYARQYYSAQSPLQAQYPEMQLDPLLMPDESWSHMQSMLDENKILIELEPNTLSYDPSSYHLAAFPFTNKSGYKYDCWGYAKTIEELNAPNFRFDQDGDPLPKLTACENWHKEAAERDQKKIYNGDIFCARAIRTDAGTTTIVVSEGKYYDFMNTCEVLGFETADQLRQLIPGNSLSGQSNVERQLSERMSNRLKLRGQSIDIFDLSKRAVGIGICTLLVRLDDVNGKRRASFYMHDRSIGRATEAMSTLHVVPAGSFSPYRDVTPTDFDNDYGHLRDAIIIEALDEFKNKNLAKKLRVDPVSLRDSDPDVCSINKLLDSKQWQLFYIGQGLARIIHVERKWPTPRHFLVG